MLSACPIACAGYTAMKKRTKTPPTVLTRPLQPPEFVKCVRAILREDPGKRILGAEIARQLGTNQRSLVRHLSSEGTTFRQICGQVQFQASQRLLRKGVSVSAVAQALGFSEISAFTHAFRRWSGESPSSWRLRYERGNAEQPRSPRAPREVSVAR